MKNLTRHTGKLEQITRLPSSVNGNPRYSAYVAGVNFRTAGDSSFGYCLTNYDGCTVVVTIGTHYGYATLDSIKKAEAAK